MNLSTGRIHWTHPAPALPALPKAADAPCARLWSAATISEQHTASLQAMKTWCRCSGTSGCKGKRCSPQAVGQNILDNLLTSSSAQRSYNWEQRWQQVRKNFTRWASPDSATTIGAGSDGVSFYANELADLSLFRVFFSNPVLRRGTFVEIGGQDGVMASNTLFFEKTLHWSGVLVEPTPVGKCVLPHARPHAKCIHAGACLVPGQLEPCSEGSVSTRGWCSWATGPCNAARIVPCLPMGAHLSHLSGVDLLVIDVENSHWHVLLSMPWETLRVDVILLECSGPRMCKAFLHTEGFDCFDWGDLLCVRRACLRDRQKSF